MKTVYDDNQLALVKKAENSENVTALLYPDFIESTCIFYMLKIILGDSGKFFNKIKGPDYLIFYLVSLFYKEFNKIVLVKNDCSVFLLISHDTKI